MSIGSPFVAALSCLALAVGCGAANPAVVTHADPEARFDGFRTFDLLPGGSGLEDDRVDVGQLDGFIADAIVRTLESKGYERVADGRADFMVGYHVALEAALSVHRMNTGYEYAHGWGWTNWGLGPGPTMEPDTSGTGGSSEYHEYYDEGWIVIDVMRTETRHLVWRAGVHGQMDMNATPAQRRHRVDRVVRDLFHDFPSD